MYNTFTYNSTAFNSLHALVQLAVTKLTNPIMLEQSQEAVIINQEPNEIYLG
jgi:hypothetical protein